VHELRGSLPLSLFGQTRALLEDTGSASPPIPLYATVKRIIDRWLLNHGMSTIPLTVAHSHSHGDHVANDNQFIGQPHTTVVGLSQTAVAQFFGITNWPEQIVEYDLGGRILDVIPIPGHQVAHIAFYDRNTQLLLTGDTLYPGRLYISDFPAYTESVQRLVDFTATNTVSYVLGTHIEMSTTRGEDFPLGSTFHPNEHRAAAAPVPFARAPQRRAGHAGVAAHRSAQGLHHLSVLTDRERAAALDRSLAAHGRAGLQNWRAEGGTDPAKW
jgi:glyoxylase-like metal-dependent hydrolase (beta-lactamase superfamily II)